MQIVPGIFLFPFQADLGPGTDLFSNGTGLVDWQNPLAEKPPWLKWVPPATLVTVDVKFGTVSPPAVVDASLEDARTTSTGSTR